MQELGVSVIRITNDKLYMEPGYVFEKIDEVVNTLTLDPSYIPHPNPLPTTPRTSSLGEGAGTSKDEVCYT